MEKRNVNLKEEIGNAFLALALLGAIFFVLAQTPIKKVLDRHNRSVYERAYKEKIAKQVQKNKQSEYTEKITAYTYLQIFIENNLLKSPGSAKFPALSRCVVQKQGANTWLIKSYVDSENSFGAVIRTHFAGIMEKSGEVYVVKKLAVVK